MPRGVKVERTYTGKALEVQKKIEKLQADLKVAKEELKQAYKEQLKQEKQAKKKAEKAASEKIMKAIASSNRSPEEILAFLNGEAK